MMQRAIQHIPHLLPRETLNAENCASAKESKQMILQTKLIIVEILNVSINFFASKFFFA